MPSHTHIIHINTPSHTQTLYLPTHPVKPIHAQSHTNYTYRHTQARPFTHIIHIDTLSHAQSHTHYTYRHTQSHPFTHTLYIPTYPVIAARVLLYAPSQKQDNTYHGLCYTSRGALAGTRNSSMCPPHEGSTRRPIAP